MDRKKMVCGLLIDVPEGMCTVEHMEGADKEIESGGTLLRRIFVKLIPPK